MASDGEFVGDIVAEVLCVDVWLEVGDSDAVFDGVIEEEMLCEADSDPDPVSDPD